MPRYNYEDQNTKKTVEVFRSLDEWDVKPTKEECEKEGISAKEWLEAKWERVIKAGGKSIGFGMKGNW